MIFTGDNKNKGLKLCRQYHPSHNAHTIYLINNNPQECEYTTIEIIRNTSEFKNKYKKLLISLKK